MINERETLELTQKVGQINEDYSLLDPENFTTYAVLDEDDRFPYLELDQSNQVVRMFTKRGLIEHLTKRIENGFSATERLQLV